MHMILTLSLYAALGTGLGGETGTDGYMCVRGVCHLSAEAVVPVTALGGLVAVLAVAVAKIRKRRISGYASISPNQLEPI